MFSSMTSLKVEIPKGLPSLIHRLSKAIIRAQPDDLYDFCATYLDEELRIRDQQQQEEPPKTTAAEDEAGMQYDKRREDSGKYAGNNEDSSKKENEHEKAATKIQAGFRGYKTRKEMSLVKRRSTEEGSKKLKSPQLSTIKEEEEAATKIQAGVRGYLLRKKMKHSSEIDNSQSSVDMDKSQSIDMGEPIDESENIPSMQSNQEDEFIIKQNYEEAETIPVNKDGRGERPAKKNRPATGTLEESVSSAESTNSNLNDAGGLEVIPELEKGFPLTKSEIVTNDNTKMADNAGEDQLSSSKALTVEAVPDTIKEEFDPQLLPSVSEDIGGEMDDGVIIVEPEIQHQPELGRQKQDEAGTEKLLPTTSLSSKAEIINVVEISSSSVLEEQNDKKEPTALGDEIEPQVDSFADEIKSLDELEETSVTETGEDAGSVIITPEPTTAVELEKQLSREAAGEPKRNAEATEATGDDSNSTETRLESQKKVQVSDKTEPVDLAEDAPVQRRSSKRKTVAGAEKYRSGVVVDSFLLEEPAAKNIHQLHQLKELDAEIEADAAEMNSAAARIQAGFRGYQVRKGLNNAATKIQSNYRGYKTRKDLRNRADAAVKIQATVRGYLARKRVYKTRAQQSEQRRRDAARRRSSSSLAANLGLAAARKRNSE